MVRYLADFADAFHLRVRYDTRVVRVSRQDGAFRVTDEQGRIHEAQAAGCGDRSLGAIPPTDPRYRDRGAVRHRLGGPR